ncbi:hypothetical protein [Romboutsia lituseburensis]|uniref:Uncharacterized protein n=1 Tax=Romboutsia lituseburensis DSM 797 TaxID=1121325 RepID=A0A1G9PJT8_9FIRM|nr:hypothetical protein [Romboutsia lituseburensis]CEH33422.1 Hypothetical protein RLITU_0821 [Romboutsia lituseburensis]SDL99096.1 hypothetical protein SAMN04515677_104399 [Romboutsia lituseburensis DSM 797]
MNNKVKIIININIDKTEFDEENQGVVETKTFNNNKIGLKVSQIDNGSAELWFGVDEAQQIISALQLAIKDIKDNK